MGARLCRRCLFSELDQNEIFRGVSEHVRLLDESVRVEEEVYRRRLAACRECVQLADGMCRLCGCFVEVRAALSARACPACAPRWGAEAK